jgi:hypothetical protein
LIVAVAHQEEDLLEEESQEEALAVEEEAHGKNNNLTVKANDTVIFTDKLTKLKQIKF